MATKNDALNLKSYERECDDEFPESNDTSSTDSSTTERHLTPGLLPTSSSYWTSRDLKLIGVSYSTDVCEMGHLISLIQKGRELPVSTELPEIGRTLVELTKKAFNVSFKFEKPRSHLDTSRDLAILSNLVSGFSSQIEAFREQHNRLLLDSTNFRAFWKWSCSIREFFTDIQSFVIRKDQGEPTEEMFRHLFMMFSRICLLKPEPGEAYTGSLRIKGQEVHAVPDIRFTCNVGGHLLQIQVVTVTEMNKHDACKSSPKRVEGSRFLTSKICGRHASELLIELSSSFFMPAVLGIVCIGTKIIFTFLEMDIDVFCKQLHQKVEKGNRIHPVIQYTKTHDYMDVNERTEILEFLFWLGYVQSMGYRDI